MSRQLDAVDHEFIRSLNPSLVVANDLFGALVSYELWGGQSTKILYDAQEIFTDMYDVIDGPALSDAERADWIRVESALCERCHEVVTVSSGIAELYELRHGVTAKVIPNFVPRSHHVPRGSRTGPVRFVYMGRIEANRGLENLIENWDFPQEVAQLSVIVPTGPERTGLALLSRLRHRDFAAPIFVPSVEPTEMMSCLSSFDVGVLPYDYPYPYSNASPNKFGEYLGAGLPVIANEQEFVSQIIASNGVGSVFRWSSPGSFTRVVSEMLDRSKLEILSSRVQEVAQSCLNWDYYFDSVWEGMSADLSSRGTHPCVEGEIGSVSEDFRLSQLFRTQTSRLTLAAFRRIFAILVAIRMARRIAGLRMCSPERMR